MRQLLLYNKGWAAALALGAITSTLLIGSSGAQDGRLKRGAQNVATLPHSDIQKSSRPSSESTLKADMNSWTVGLAGGPLDGAPIRFAAEIARVVDDGPNLQVLPIVTRGVTENLNALLYQKGIDAAIINTDVLQTFRAENPSMQRKVVNLLSLFPSEVHVFVRPEINSLQDLTGKKVNFNTQGTAAAYTGPLVFQRVGVDIEKLFIPHPLALEQMRKGEIAGVVFVTSKPIEAFLKGRWEPGFKFLEIEYTDKFSDYYLPSALEAQDYPNLVGQGRSIRTIAVPTALVGFNWAKNSDRYRRMARLTEYLFDRFEQLQEAGFHPKWKDVNLAGTVPGLERFAVADEWLKQYRGGGSSPKLTGSGPTSINPGQIRAQAARAAPYDRAEQERLFQEFMEWRRSRQ